MEEKEPSTTPEPAEPDPGEPVTEGDVPEPQTEEPDPGETETSDLGPPGEQRDGDRDWPSKPRRSG